MTFWDPRGKVAGFVVFYDVHSIAFISETIAPIVNLIAAVHSSHVNPTRYLIRMSLQSIVQPSDVPPNRDKSNMNSGFHHVVTS